MFNFVRKSIGVKVSFTMAGIILTSFAIMTILFYTQFAGSLERSITASMQKQAEQNASILAEQLNVYKAKVSGIASNATVRSMDWDFQKPVLEEGVKLHNFMKMGVANPAGDIVYTNGQTLNVAQREYFTAAMAGETFISDPLMSAAEHVLVVVFSAPIRDDAGKPVGVLTATVDGQFLSSLCAGISIGESGYGFILNKDGATIGHVDAAYVESGYNALKEAEQDAALGSLAEIEAVMIGGSAGSGTYWKDGLEYYLAYAPIPGTAWALGVTAEKWELLKDLEVLRNSAILLTCVFLAFLFLVCLWLLRILVTRPLREMLKAAESLEKGDLTYRLPEASLRGMDEMSAFAKSFDKTINSLNATVQHISAASSQVAAGSEQISASSVALSKGAMSQASAIEQLTASMEEIASQTRINAENAENANRYAEEAKRNAVSGNEEMENMLRAMEAINESSGDIGKIIKVIDDIAFQTNILALNAAVEAARAGEHGKGFAVVAEEVRNLAAKSANAAKETTAMIETSIQKTAAGSAVAQDTATALQEIMRLVQEAASLMNSISESSNEQAAGIDQLRMGLDQITQVVQANSSSAIESSAASEKLLNQAELLKEQVAYFKLRNGYTESASAAV